MTPCHAGQDRARGAARAGRVAPLPAPPGRWEALMATAQAGDGVAYDALLRELLPMLRGMARRQLADPAEAEDAVQDTLLTFHRLRRAYDPTRPIRPWLAAICERRCLDRLRRRMRETARETSFEAFADRLGAPRVDSSSSSLRRSAAVRGCQMR
jgi:RNA polymerase sigma-70 factor, ECF subfamily